MALTTNERLMEALSLAVEDRSSGYQDLVSNSNVLLAVMKKKGMWKPYSGPTIRERLMYGESGSYVRYKNYDFLNPKPAELINDAEFTPKQAAVSVTLSGTDILSNSGNSQLMDIFRVHIDAAEQELVDRFTEDLHSDGTGSGGLQIGGLQFAIPTVVNAGVYGGISRVTQALWRTSAYDANSFLAPYTQVDATSVRPMFSRICIERSRGKTGPDLILASQEHFIAFENALTAIQRVTDGEGVLGFRSLKFAGAGKSVDVTLEGGIGSAMPGNTTYFIATDHLRFRYHPERNFSKIGGKQMPVNQDAIVQHLGFMGELTLVNPLHMAKLYDSAP